MKVEFWVIGKTNQAYLKEGISIYEKRIQRYLKMEMVVLSDIKNAKNLPSKQLKEKEGTQILNKLAKRDGGAFGFSPSVYERANFKIRLSSMTFSHQMIRLFFIEQFYRAMTILKNEPYHNS